MSDEQKLIRLSIELGSNAARGACLKVGLAFKEGTSAEGILAHELKQLMNNNSDGYYDTNDVSRDNIIEGFCDELQKFIEAWFGKNDLSLDLLTKLRL